jgi:hypothetical protein
LRQALPQFAPALQCRAEAGLNENSTFGLRADGVRARTGTIVSIAGLSPHGTGTIVSRS